MARHKPTPEERSKALAAIPDPRERERKAKERQAKSPVFYSKEIVDQILNRLRNDETLTDVCTDEGMPDRGTFLDWVDADRDGLAHRYARARADGADGAADRIKYLAERSIGMPFEGIQAVRLLIDAIKWRAEKLARDRYGPTLELKGALTLAIESRSAGELFSEVQQMAADMGVALLQPGDDAARLAWLRVEAERLGYALVSLDLVVVSRAESGTGGAASAAPAS